MDEFAKRLKQDAASIEADVSPELKVRIDASVHAMTREADKSKSTASHYSLWWASSLTGLVAAAVIIALLNRNTVDQPMEPAQQPVATVVPEYVRQLNSGFALRAENADFAEPLEVELKKLKADMEKARLNVRRDLKSSF